MTNSEMILDVARKNGGTITTRQVNELNIKRSILYSLVNKGLLEYSSRGVYILPGNFDDEFYNLQVRYKKGVFSNISALYLLKFTDRTPVKFDMSFPAPYNTSTINKNIITHRLKPEIYINGIVKSKTPFGNQISLYCIERTLCDILQQRNNVEIQIITDAFKNYTRYKDKNIPLLLEYAKLLKIENKVRPYFGVLI